MMGAILRKVFGTSKDRDYKRLKPLLDATNGHEARFSSLSNNELRAQTGLFKQRLADGETLDDLLPEAFAVVREASKRVTGMRPFDVQVIGGVVLHNGDIAEMVTGEGKTLVATMPMYLNALTGRGVHLVTVNDYLARRDSQWMGPIFEFLGLTVGLIQHDMHTFERQVAYKSDITYGTNNEFGFDYLRDNMAIRPEMRVQRGLNYAIVDEVDSILVDEARTPLIISGRSEKSTDLYQKVNEQVKHLMGAPSTPQLMKEIQLYEEGGYDTVDPSMSDEEKKAFLKKKEELKRLCYTYDEKGHSVILTQEGMTKVERLLGIEDLYSGSSGTIHIIEQALKAHNFYKKDDEYVVKDGEVLIVDEFTGRMMEGRRYSDGLHQAIEAKEGVPVQFESQTVASITYQNLFKLYGKLAGMTGTAVTEAVEFSSTYELDVIQVPTNLPMFRDDMTDLVFATELGKFKYVVGEIEEIHKTGRPILVGTVSIEKSEQLASLMKERGMKNFEVLNAKQHDREASIVANAGKPGSITIATNMAGRGTDIKLGEGVRELGGLAIIGTERHESRRIDNQLRGRCGRQGDPGTTRFFVSLEDEVARLFGGDKVKRLIDLFGGEQMDAEPLDQKMVSRSIQRAQRQVEEYNGEIRKHLLEYDNVMNTQRKVIYKLRQDVLEDRDITEQLQDMFEEVIVDGVNELAPEGVEPEEWDLEGLATRLRMLFGFEPNLDEPGSDIVVTLFDQVLDEYARREKLIEEETRNDFHAQVGPEDTGVDFAKLARKRVHDLEMMALLGAVDDKWIDHLYSMDYLKDSVRLRAYGQRDPLVEYKTEGFAMFETLMLTIYETVIHTLFRVTDPEIRQRRRISAGRGAPPPEDDPFAQLSRYTYVSADKEQDQSFATYDTSRFKLAGQDSDSRTPQAVAEKKRPVQKTVRRVGVKVKPNDPCPCGSGKKHKKCCGART